MGVVFLEANACGTPVIGSKVGGILDIIEDGVNGFYVQEKNPLDLAEKIIRLSEEKKLRTQMGENGRKLVELQFNWETLAGKIIDVYDSLLCEKTVSNR